MVENSPCELVETKDKFASHVTLKCELGTYDSMFGELPVHLQIKNEGVEDQLYMLHFPKKGKGGAKIEAIKFKKYNTEPIEVCTTKEVPREEVFESGAKRVTIRDEKGNVFKVEPDDTVMITLCATMDDEMIEFVRSMEESWRKSGKEVL